MSTSVNIISTSPIEVCRRNFRWARYVVPAAPKGGYSKTPVSEGTDTLMAGSNVRLPVAYSARSVAEDVIRGYEEFGVFIIEGEEPTDAELRASNKQRMKYYRYLVDEADTSWRSYGNRSLINGHAHIAVEELSLKREWALETNELVDCPSCFQKIVPGTVRCPKCTAVLDQERARQYFPELYRNSEQVRSDAISTASIPTPQQPTKPGKAQEGRS